MKLHILPPFPKEKVEQKKKEDAGYGSPVGWWKVTTEGDCEGRTTKQLGEFYGHVAEIALFLADKCCYSLRFRPIKGREAVKRETLRATKNAVWISLDIEGRTWEMNFERRANWMSEWLNANESIDVLPTDGYAHYYASTYIKLKK